MNKTQIGSIISLIIIAVFTLIAFFLKPIEVAGTAMEPAMMNGDFHFTQRFTLLFSGPSAGDIVLYRPHKDEEDYHQVGRVVAIPGDSVNVSNESISVNNSVLQSAGIDHVSQTITLQDNQYFIIGDNSKSVNDSRSIGPIEKSEILYIVWFKYLSGN